MAFSAIRISETKIIWQRTISKGLMTRQLPTNHDVILCYQNLIKRLECRRDVRAVHMNDLDEKTLEKGTRQFDPHTGRRYQLTSLLNPSPDRPNLTYEFLGVKRVWRWTKERMQAAMIKGCRAAESRCSPTL